MIRPWWERWRGRLEFELQRLDEAGIKYRLDAEARAAGIIKLFLQHRLGAETIDLTAIFPDFYPYFRFEVQAPNLFLNRHQHPLGKNLCLIGRATANWRTTDTLADFIMSRLPLALHAARSPNAPETIAAEEHQGEPATDYFSYAPDMAVLIDSAWRPDRNAYRGFLTLGANANFRAHPGPRFQAIVKLITTETHQQLAAADASLAACFQSELRTRWLRLNERPPLLPPEDLAQWLGRLDARVLRPEWRPLGGARIDVTGVVFPEEVGYQSFGDGWLFILRIAQPGTNAKRWKSCYVRAVRGGRLDMTGRIPELTPLSKASVIIAGLGALGAPSAIDLARAGTGELRLLDFDHVQPGTTVRWPVGLPAAGLLKTTTLPEVIRQNWPFTKVRTYVHRIGTVRDVSVPIRPDQQVLEPLLDRATLVYDCTAEIGVQHLLSDLARERSLPYVCVSATEGAWGGLVARIRPGKTEGCWNCLMHDINAKTIPTPPKSPTGTVQTIGCANPTFTGAGFDLAHIAIAGTRLAVATLCAGQDAYPDYDWDVACISFRNERGQAIAPHWQTFALKPHPECQLCRNAAA